MRRWFRPGPTSVLLRRNLPELLLAGVRRRRSGRVRESDRANAHRRHPACRPCRKESRGSLAKVSGSEAGEKSLVGAPLPKPKGDEGQVHRQQDKREIEIDSMKQRQQADGVEPGVVPEKIPPAHDSIKMMTIAEAVLIGHDACHGAARQGAFHLAMQTG